VSAEPDVIPDEQLYQSWALGDRRAGSRLVDRFVRPIARFFANKIADVTDAEELVAETFEIVARKLGDYAGEGSFRSYVFGIAHNVLRNYIKKKRRGGREIDPETDAIAALGPSPTTAIGARREHHLLLRGLRSVPIDDQVLLELGYFEQMSRTEIAAALGWPVGTVASRMRRAHDRLETALATLAEEPSLLHSTVHGLADWAAQLRAHIDDEYGRSPRR
jgi:RNA polymerase sigma factor (sigma-70 family)